MNPRRGVTAKRRSARGSRLAGFSFLPERFARRLAGLSEAVTGAALRRAALIACFIFYGLTGLYAAALNGAFDGSTAFARTVYRSVTGFAPLTISKIEIDGIKNGRRKQVLSALGVEPGQSILWLDTHDARARIESLRWVEQATVLRLLPDVVKVSVKERTPFAVWQRGGNLAVIDEQGLVIADASGADYAALPLVVGFGANIEAKEFLSMVRRWPNLAARMRAGVRVADRRWNIRLHNGVDIRLPEKNVAAAVDELAALDEAYGLLQRDIAGIDLRLPDRLTIRLTDEAASRRQAAIKTRKKAPSHKKGADT